MGDPKFVKKKFSKPSHPWQSARIEAETALSKEYGLKNKRESWKMGERIKMFKKQAKQITALKTEQAKKEEHLLLEKLYRLNLLQRGGNVTVDEVLNLTTKDMLERRLQTIVFKKGLAKSVKQARQFITHRHITVGGKLVTAPSYIVSAEEEPSISFIPKSALAKEDHPERAVEKRTPGDRPKKGKAAEEEKGGFRRERKGHARNAHFKGHAAEKKNESAGGKE